MTEKLTQLCRISKKLNALYVEDDVNLIKTTQSMLQNIFDKVIIAKNGKEGLSEYKKYFSENDKYFDIVVTDIKMPEMNGIEFCKKIKKINNKQIIVVTSAHDDSSSLIEFINFGVKKFIKKPFTIHNIIITFSEVVKELEVGSIKTIDIVDGYSWNTEYKTLFKEKEEIKLTRNEVLILDILLNNKEQIFSNEDFFYILQEDNFDKDLSTNSIKSLLKRLRKKLPENLIENIYGQGYRLNTSKLKKAY